MTPNIQYTPISDISIEFRKKKIMDFANELPTDHLTFIIQELLDLLRERV